MLCRSLNRDFFFKSRKKKSTDDLNISIIKFPLSFPLKNHTTLGLGCKTLDQFHLWLLVKGIKGSGKIEEAGKNSKTGREAIKKKKKLDYLEIRFKALDDKVHRGKLW